MSVVTRFAPSPTGYLHIGGARTAYFNWLYAKKNKGKFLLRIEDTDRERSTNEAVAKIHESLEWLGIKWDGDSISQFQNRHRHKEIAMQMLASGHAYKCYAQPDELETMRATQKEKGLAQRYDGRWRDRPESEAPKGIDPVIRLKAPLTGETTLHDEVQGTITVQNEQLDDMVLLRSDGTPTYMLSVVVDDHDMGITHVIRGDDHLTNTFRQLQIYNAMSWKAPSFSHIPLIHGPDGAKLSKRHGALGAESYRDMGYLPEAMKNYLLRLGWSHGDDEIIPTEQAIEWFTLKNIGKSPSRFDIDKLNSINAHYIKQCDDAKLYDLSMPFLQKAMTGTLSTDGLARFKQALPLLKERAKTLIDLADLSTFLLYENDIEISEKAQSALTPEATAQFKDIITLFESMSHWDAGTLETTLKSFAEAKELKIGKIMPSLRAAACGIMESPPLFQTLEILGQKIVISRLKKFI